MNFKRGLFVGCFCFVGGILNLQASFTDSDQIPQWAQKSVDTVAEAKIITGFGDGSFRPKQNLNRAEAVTLLLRIKNIDVANKKFKKGKFKDVLEGAWFESAVLEAEQQGWITGKADGDFHPGASLNRAEFATLIMRAFSLEVDMENILPFKDVPSSVWFSEAIYSLYNNGLVRYPNSEKYSPSALVSRAEAAWMFAKIWNMPRLMGTSKENNFEGRGYVDSRKTAIKPRNFDPNNQGVEVVKKELVLLGTAKDSMVSIKGGDDWVDIGTIRLSNLLEDRVEMQTLQLKLRFDRTNVGPASNFWFQLKGAGVTKEAKAARTGEVTLSGLGLHISPGDEKVLRIKIKPDIEEQFYFKSGLGKVSIVDSQSLMYGTFKKETSSRTTSIRSVPVNYEQRDLSEIEFTPY